jgi:hypothetical protein
VLASLFGEILGSQALALGSSCPENARLVEGCRHHRQGCGTFRVVYDALLLTYLEYILVVSN